MVDLPPTYVIPGELGAQGSELLPDGLITAHAPDGTIRFMNSLAERFTGVPATWAIGRPIHEAVPFRDPAGWDWWEVSNPWHGLTIRTGHRERRLLLPGGQECLVTARYVRRAPGEQPYALILGIRDAEARRRAERDTAALITTVAHELRSPLTGVKGFSATLLRNWERFSDEDKRLMIETIESDADRVTRLITELLDVSRISAGRLKLHPVPVPLREFLEMQVERRVVSGVDRSRFAISMADGLTDIWADRDRIEQVIGNLVENALRYGAGQITLSADEVDISRGRTGVRLRVCDEGEGVPPEKRELIFSRFWRGKSRQGTGLGLFLVRGLVEGHGGSAVCVDGPTSGACFEVTFPDPIAMSEI